jgi:uncharacterized protein
MSTVSRLRMGIALATILIAISCRSTAPPISYYALSSPHTQATEATSRKIRIGIGPVALPPYLDRQQLVVRTGLHQLRIDDYHLWAAPLSEELPRILAENIMRANRSLRVERMPWGHRFAPDIVIGIQIFNFEAHASGRVHLNASITMSDPRNQDQNTWSVDLEEKAEGTRYPDLLLAQSHLLAELGRRIVNAIP